MKKYQNFINGKLMDSKSGRTFENRNPANWDEVVGVFPKSNVDDLNLEERRLRKLGRRGAEGLIELDAEISEALKSYLEKERPSLAKDKNEPALFLNLRGNRLTRQGLWLIVKKRSQEVGIESEISPRTLRRSHSRQEELKAP